jgi:uncharacterized protein (TIGR03663 family)
MKKGSEVIKADLSYLRPLFWRATFFVAVALGLALRLFALDWRPLHHDEAVNWWFGGRWSSGEFRYDPANYHGPLLFALTAWLKPIGDLGESGLRLPVALASAALPLALLPLRAIVGWRPLALGAVLLALSTTLLWVGRYYIHETLLVAATLAFATCCARVWITRDPRAWFGAALALAVMFALKETTIATLAALVVGAFAVAWPARRRGTKLAALARPAWPGGRVAALGASSALLLLAWAYTSGFAHARGLVDFLRAFALWTHTGVAGAGHTKPWWYYAMLLGRYETGLLVLAIAAAPLLWRGDSLARFCATWFLALLAAYSVTPYKTPWLVINIALPLVLLATLAADHWLRRAPRVAAPVLAVLVAVQAVLAVRLSFVDYTDAREPMVYMQHTDAVRKLAARAIAHVRRSGDGDVLIQSAESWPLPYYLRSLSRLGFTTAPLQGSGAAVVIVDTRLGDVAPREPSRYARERVDVRPDQTYVLWLRRDSR